MMKYGYRVLALCFLLACTQAPAFITQYTNTLGGAVAESKILYMDLETRAALRGLSVQDYIAHHMRSDDAIFRESGAALSTTVARYQSNALALEELRSATVWARPFICVHRIDPSVVSAMRFTPSVPLNFEALCYAFFGWIALLVGTSLLKIARFRLSAAQVKH